jgi:hypothetical protein
MNHVRFAKTAQRARDPGRAVGAQGIASELFDRDVKALRACLSRKDPVPRRADGIHGKIAYDAVPDKNNFRILPAYFQ